MAKQPVERQLFAIGQEVEELGSSEMEEIHEVTLGTEDVLDANVAHVTYGNITFQVVTKTELR